MLSFCSPLTSLPRRPCLPPACSDCDFVLDVPTVSGRHARLEVVRRRDAKGGYSKLVVTDLGSTNGTRVNRWVVGGPLAGGLADCFHVHVSWLLGPCCCVGQVCCACVRCQAARLQYGSAWATLRHLPAPCLLVGLPVCLPCRPSAAAGRTLRQTRRLLCTQETCCAWQRQTSASRSKL